MRSMEAGSFDGGLKDLMPRVQRAAELIWR